MTLSEEIEAAREFVANAAKWNDRGDPRAAKAGLCLAETALAQAATLAAQPPGPSVALREALDVCALAAKMDCKSRWSDEGCDAEDCLHCQAAKLLPELRCHCGKFVLDRSSPSMFEKPIYHAPDECAAPVPLPRCPHCKQTTTAELALATAPADDRQPNRQETAGAPREGEPAKQDALRKARDAAYSERNQCVALILRMGLALGWRAGVGRHEDKPGETWEDDWRTLVSVDLPTGQASWHFHDSERGLLAGLPAYPAPWDGHDTAEKYRRVNAALAAPQPLPSAPPVGATHRCRRERCSAYWNIRGGAQLFISARQKCQVQIGCDLEPLAATEPLSSAKPRDVPEFKPLHGKVYFEPQGKPSKADRLTAKAQWRAKVAHKLAPPPDTRPDCTATTRRGNRCVMKQDGASGFCGSHAASAWHRYVKNGGSQHPPEGPPATAGHNPEGVEARDGLDAMQARVDAWVRLAFREEALTDRWERVARVLEEAIELAQAEGMTCDEVIKSASWVFNRPQGEVNQEAGGIMVCLLAWAAGRQTSLASCALREIDRIEQPATIEKIRRKQAEKAAAGTGHDFAAPLPSAPVDISLGECSAWTDPAPQATPAPAPAPAARHEGAK